MVIKLVLDDTYKTSFGNRSKDNFRIVYKQNMILKLFQGANTNDHFIFLCISGQQIMKIYFKFENNFYFNLISSLYKRLYRPEWTILNNLDSNKMQRPMYLNFNPLLTKYNI